MPELARPEFGRDGQQIIINVEDGGDLPRLRPGQQGGSVRTAIAAEDHKIGRESLKARERPTLCIGPFRIATERLPDLFFRDQRRLDGAGRDVVRKRSIEADLQRRQVSVGDEQHAPALLLRPEAAGRPGHQVGEGAGGHLRIGLETPPLQKRLLPLQERRRICLRVAGERNPVLQRAHMGKARITSRIHGTSRIAPNGRGDAGEHHVDQDRGGRGDAVAVAGEVHLVDGVVVYRHILGQRHIVAQHILPARMGPQRNGAAFRRLRRAELPEDRNEIRLEIPRRGKSHGMQVLAHEAPAALVGGRRRLEQRGRPRDQQLGTLGGGKRGKTFRRAPPAHHIRRERYFLSVCTDVIARLKEADTFKAVLKRHRDIGGRLRHASHHE